MPGFEVRNATERDVPLILALVRALDEYESLSHKVPVTGKGLREWLFGNILRRRS